MLSNKDKVMENKTTAEIEGPEVFTVGDWNMPVVEMKVAKLNKRAAKLGCPDIEINIIGTESRVAPEYSDKVKNGNEADFPHITVISFTIVGEGPKLAGWKFIGTLDHITLPGSVIVNTVPGESVPEQFYHNDAVCDHCDKVRYRNETFVVEHEGGDQKQIGRSCLKDFLGHDPRQVAAYLRSLYKFLEVIQEEEFGYGGGGGRMTYTYPKTRSLQVTAAIIDSFGWVPRSASDEKNTATSIHVAYYFNGPLDSKDRPAWEKWKAALDVDNINFVAEAKNSRLWIAEQKANNEYLHNLVAIHNADGDIVPAKLIGYWASLVSAYQRDQDRLKSAERIRELKVNAHVGEIKKRQNFDVSVVSKRQIDGMYGTVTIVRFLDSEGHTITWFANADVDMKNGNAYKIKATVKKHDEYNDWKQTVVTRVAVLEEVKTEKEVA